MLPTSATWSGDGSSMWLWATKQGSGTSRFGRKFWKRHVLKVDAAAQTLAWMDSPDGEAKGSVNVSGATLTLSADAKSPFPNFLILKAKSKLKFHFETPGDRLALATALTCAANGDNPLPTGFQVTAAATSPAAAGAGAAAAGTSSAATPATTTTAAAPAAPAAAATDAFHGVPLQGDLKKVWETFGGADAVPTKTFLAALTDSLGKRVDTPWALFRALDPGGNQMVTITNAHAVLGGPDLAAAVTAAVAAGKQTAFPATIAPPPAGHQEELTATSGAVCYAVAGTGVITTGVNHATLSAFADTVLTQAKDHDRFSGGIFSVASAADSAEGVMFDVCTELGIAVGSAGDAEDCIKRWAVRRPGIVLLCIKASRAFGSDVTFALSETPYLVVFVAATSGESDVDGVAHLAEGAVDVAAAWEAAKDTPEGALLRKWYVSPAAFDIAAAAAIGGCTQDAARAALDKLAAGGLVHALGGTRWHVPDAVVSVALPAPRAQGPPEAITGYCAHYASRFLAAAALYTANATMTAFAQLDAMQGHVHGIQRLAVYGKSQPKGAQTALLSLFPAQGLLDARVCLPELWAALADTAKDVLGAADAVTGTALHCKGISSDDEEVARHALKESLAIRKAALGDAHPDVGASLVAVGSREEDTGAQIEQLNAGIAVLKAAHGDTHPAVIAAMMDLSRVLASESPSDAVAKLKEALAAGGSRRVGPQAIWERIANVLYDDGKMKEAMAAYEEAFAACKAVFGDTHLQVGHVAYAAANLVAWDDGMASASAEWFDRARLVYATACGEDHPSTAECREQAKQQRDRDDS